MRKDAETKEIDNGAEVNRTAVDMFILLRGMFGPLALLYLVGSRR
jgi:hypothetical protein